MSNQTTSHLLMIRPVHFAFNAETAVNNAFQVAGKDDGAQEKARQEFRNKELKMCLDTYSLIENVNLLLDLDQKIIEYCKRNLKY